MTIWVDKLKDGVQALEVFYKLLCLAIAIGAGAAAWVLPNSRPLSILFITGVAIGTLTAVLVVFIKYHGKSEADRVRAGRRRLFGGLIAGIVALILRAIFEPGVARLHGWLVAIRSVLLDVPFVVYGALAILTGVFMHLMVTAFLLKSKALAKV